jgi:uncharacterized protein YdeI (YjbR/CyaY-like superfamily)
MNDRDMEPIFFVSASDFGTWLFAHHTTDLEMWVGFYKRGTDKPTLTWPESVDQALCFGWIDGIRKSIDESSYKIRFTPRKAGSVWSAVNIRRVEELSRLGLMRPAGLEAFARRRENRSGIYSYEQRTADLPEPYAKIFKKNKLAWKFYQEQPPGYRKILNWWVVSAKQEETRLKRLAKLVEESEAGRRMR